MKKIIAVFVTLVLVLVLVAIGAGAYDYFAYGGLAGSVISNAFIVLMGSVPVVAICVLIWWIWAVAVKD